MENNSESQMKSFFSKLLTSEDLATVVQKITSNSSVKILNYIFIPYSTARLGFLGSHWNLKITVQRNDYSEQETLNLFVKSMPVNCDVQFELIQKTGVFDKESHFFETIVPQITKNCKVEQCLPSCYLTKADVIIMEDLRIQDYKISSLEEPLFDQFALLKSAFATVARFHSCSIIAEAHLSRIKSHPVTLMEFYPNGLYETMFDPDSQFWQWCSTGINLIINVSERLGYDVSHLRTAFTRIVDYVKASPSYRNVICHGDLWMNNMMFSNTESQPKCILVDFQMIRYAPLVSDIALLFYINSSKVFREKYEKTLIEYYHFVLEETIRNNNPMNDIKVPTLEEITAGYEEWRIFGSSTATLYFPTILLNSETLLEHTKSSEDFRNLIKNDRTDFILAYMKDNQLYRNKIEEVVSETIEMIKRKNY